MVPTKSSGRVGLKEDERSGGKGERREQRWMGRQVGGIEGHLLVQQQQTD